MSNVLRLLVLLLGACAAAGIKGGVRGPKAVVELTPDELPAELVAQCEAIIKKGGADSATIQAALDMFNQVNAKERIDKMQKKVEQSKIPDIPGVQGRAGIYKKIYEQLDGAYATLKKFCKKGQGEKGQGDSATPPVTAEAAPASVDPDRKKEELNKEQNKKVLAMPDAPAGKKAAAQRRIDSVKSEIARLEQEKQAGTLTDPTVS